MLSTLLFRLRRIELQLPLSVVALLLLVVVAVAWSAYHEVRRDAVESSQRHLENVAVELAGFLSQSLALRVAETQAIADRPVMREALRTDASPDVLRAAAAVLDALRATSPHIVGVGLWDPNGRLVVEVERPGTDPPWEGTSRPPAVTEPTLTELAAQDALVWFDVVGVVRDGEDVVGWVVQSRQSAAPSRSRGPLADLVGLDAMFLLGEPGGIWTDLSRVVAGPPSAASSGLGAAEYQLAERGARFAHGESIDGTRLQLWVEAPREVVLRGPRSFLARITGIGLAVVVLGGATGWGISRGVTERIDRLRVSANAIAEGRYERPPLVETDDELGELARAFDVMAAQVEASHRRLERQVAERTAELRASEEQFRTLASTANMSIVTGDADGRIVYCNAAAESMFGWTAEEAVGQSIEILVPERLREAHRRGFERYSAGGEPRIIGRTVETSARRRDGTELPIELSLASWRQDDGLRFCAIIQDISARKQDEAALQQYAAELEAANRELETFNYSASHDLRAPLRAVQGFGRYLLEDYGDRLEERGLDYVNRMCRAADRMQELIDGLLELSRTSRQELVQEEVDLSALAQQIVSELIVGAPERAVDWRIADGVRCRGDRNLLALLLRNLLGNAWKFTARTEGAAIEFDLVSGSAHTFRVQDNGAGFDMQYADQLFVPFRRLHPEAEFPGSGIGLSLVHRIVERHGGRVWAESTVGGGATFFFTLPDERA